MIKCPVCGLYLDSLDDAYPVDVILRTECHECGIVVEIVGFNVLNGYVEWQECWLGSVDFAEVVYRKEIGEVTIHDVIGVIVAWIKRRKKKEGRRENDDIIQF